MTAIYLRAQSVQRMLSNKQITVDASTILPAFLLPEFVESRSGARRWLNGMSGMQNHDYLHSASSSLKQYKYNKATNPKKTVKLLQLHYRNFFISAFAQALIGACAVKGTACSAKGDASSEECSDSGSSNHQRVVNPTGKVYFAYRREIGQLLSVSSSILTRAYLHSPEGNCCVHRLGIPSSGTVVVPIQHHQAVSCPICRLEALCLIRADDEGPVQRASDRDADSLGERSTGIFWNNGFACLCHSVN